MEGKIMKKFAIIFGIAIAAIVSVIGISNAVAEYEQIRIEASEARAEQAAYWDAQTADFKETADELLDSEYYKELGYNSQENIFW